MLVRRDLLHQWPAPHLISAHAHLLLAGSVLHVILGTAIWLFPRPRADDPRVRAWHGEMAWWCLSAGTTLRGVGEIVTATHPALGWRLATVTGGLLQVLGLLAGVLALRPRIRAAGAGNRQ